MLPASDYLDLFPADGVRRGRVDAAVPAPRLGPGRRGPAGARTRRSWCCCATRSSGSAPRCGWPPPGGCGQPVAVALPGADHDADLHRLLRRPAGRVGRRGGSGADGRAWSTSRSAAAPAGRRRRRLAPARPRPGAAGRRRRGLAARAAGRDWELARGAPGVAAGDVPPPARPASSRDWGLDLSRRRRAAHLDRQSADASAAGTASRSRPVTSKGRRAASPAPLAELGDLLGRRVGEVVADRAGRLLVGRPPVLERVEPRLSRDSSPALDVGEAGLAEEPRQVALPRAGKPDSPARPGRAGGAPTRTARADRARRRGPRRRRRPGRPAGSPAPSRPARAPGRP